MTIDEIMRAAPVIPVLVLEGKEDWAALAEAFVAGGLPVLEVTLRTPEALDAIRAMAEVPGAIVGAGTVLNADQLAQALDAGSRFAVSPGLTEPLAKAAREAGIPFLPGVSTGSDIMRGMDLGLDRFKFFPAEASGGIAALQALSGPFAEPVSARRAASGPSPRASGSRSRRCCASAARGSIAAATASAMSTAAPAPLQRCVSKAPINHIGVIVSSSGSITWRGR